MRAQISKLMSDSGFKAVLGRATEPPAAPGRDRGTGLRRTLAVAVAGLTLSVGTALVVAHWESKVAELAFVGRANNVATTLQTGLNENLSKIVALRALFEASDAGHPGRIPDLCRSPSGEPARHSRRGMDSARVARRANRA